MDMVDITNWASDEVKTIDVTQEVGNTYYTLKVRKFVPVQGDALSRRWVYDGVPYEYECAPYAVADMQEAGKVLSQFSENTLSTAIPFWIKHDPLLRKTYSMAYQYSMVAEVCSRSNNQTKLTPSLARRRPDLVEMHPETMGCIPHDVSRSKYLWKRDPRHGTARFWTDISQY